MHWRTNRAGYFFSAEEGVSFEVESTQRVHIIFFAIFLSLCRKQESMSLRHLPCWHLIPYRRKTCCLNQDTANGPTCEKYKEENLGEEEEGASIELRFES